MFIEYLLNFFGVLPEYKENVDWAMIAFRNKLLVIVIIIIILDFSSQLASKDYNKTQGLISPTSEVDSF